MECAGIGRNTSSLGGVLISSSFEARRETLSVAFSFARLDLKRSIEQTLSQISTNLAVVVLLAFQPKVSISSYNVLCPWAIVKNYDFRLHVQTKLSTSSVIANVL